MSSTFRSREVLDYDSYEEMFWNLMTLFFVHTLQNISTQIILNFSRILPVCPSISRC